MIRVSKLSCTTKLFNCLGFLLIAIPLLILSGCGKSNTATSVTIAMIAVAPNPESIAAGATKQFTAKATFNNGTTADVSSQVTWSSSNITIATINASGMLTAVATGATTVTASMSGVNGTVNVTVTADKTLSSIAVSPAAASVVVGATQQFTATGSYSDGTTSDITSSVTWATSTSPATINASGLATGVAAGSANVTAALSGVTGTAALTVTAQVATPTLVSIAVTPPTASAAVGATQQFTATGSYSDGSTVNLSTTAAWSVSNTIVATVGGTGLATGAAVGTTTVTASVSGISGTAALTVTALAKNIASIAVSPASTSFAAGATQQFTATATYSDGTTGDITATAAWTTANTSVATINSAGLATGVASGSTSVSAAQSGISGSASFTVTAKTLKSIAVTPATASIAIGKTQQYTATATYSDGSKGDVTKTATWTATNTTVATIDVNGLATAVAAGSTSIQASLTGVTSSKLITVTIAPGTGVNVTTWHNDNNRSGLNSGEQSLTPANVAPTNFGKLFSYQLDGYAYAEPLLVSNLTIKSAVHNVLYVATENDSVYAFDADNYGTGAPLWQVSLLQSGETPLTGAPIKPVEGITSTPVIDPASNTIYVVSTQHSNTAGATFRLNALDLATGTQKTGSPVTLQASLPGTGNTSVNGVVSLNTSCLQRAALLEANNIIYIGFGSCQRGWLLAYDATSLAQVGVFNASPNLDGEGTYMSAGGIWMGGGGPAADGSGNVYAVTGNGPWDGKTAWADTVLKFNSKLQLTDYFTPDSYQYMDCADADLASGGLLLIPGTSEALAGGKIGKLFLVNTTNMGHEATGDIGATQTLWYESDLIKPYQASCTDSTGVNTTDINPYEIFGTAAYFNGAVYLGITPTGANVPAGIRQFTYNGTLTPGPYTTASIQQNTRGTTPFISANGSNNGIVWMVDTGLPIQSSGTGAPTSAILRAYDAAHFPNELYSSSTNASDTPGFGIKFSSPVVANGKVYISTGHDNYTTASPLGEIDVYGLK